MFVNDNSLRRIENLFRYPIMLIEVAFNVVIVLPFRRTPPSARQSEV